jgi:hypothetical protein
MAQGKVVVLLGNESSSAAAASSSPSSSTSTSYSGLPSASNSFPHSQFKNTMPNDQVAKLLAMHRESTANAGKSRLESMMSIIIILSKYKNILMSI